MQTHAVPGNDTTERLHQLKPDNIHSANGEGVIGVRIPYMHLSQNCTKKSLLFDQLAEHAKAILSYSTSGQGDDKGMDWEGE